MSTKDEEAKKIQMTTEDEEAKKVGLCTVVNVQWPSPDKMTALASWNENNNDRRVGSGCVVLKTEQGVHWATDAGVKVPKEVIELLNAEWETGTT